MRVLVCGDRKYKDWSFLFAMLDDFNEHKKITCIIHGCAKGADTLSEEWALRGRSNMGDAIEICRFPADWGKYGKAAGPIRNSQMLKEGKPDYVIAFLTPHSKGTKNMIQQAQKAGVPVYVVNI